MAAGILLVQDITNITDRRFVAQRFQICCWCRTFFWARRRP